MKNHKNIIAALILILAIAGCKKYEQFPVDKVGIDKIFDPRDSAGVNAQHYLYGVYSILKNGHNRVGGDYLDAASDDAISSASGPTNVVTILSTASYNSYTIPNDESLWGTYYGGIRQANEFVNNIGGHLKPFITKSVSKCAKGNGSPRSMILKLIGLNSRDRVIIF